MGSILICNRISEACHIEGERWVDNCSRCDEKVHVSMSGLNQLQGAECKLICVKCTEEMYDEDPTQFNFTEPSDEVKQIAADKLGISKEDMDLMCGDMFKKMNQTAKYKTN